MSNSNQIKFGTDGWRAIIGDEFNYENVRRVAAGIAKYIEEKHQIKNASVVIGYDTRFSSKNFAYTVAEIISSYGINIKLFDSPSTTPACSFSVFEGNHNIGIMITASHNPKEWNGIKIKSPSGGSAEPKVIEEIEKKISIVNNNNLRKKKNSEIEIFNPNEKYINSIKQIIDLKKIKSKSIKVIVDNMHGSGSGIISSILSGGNIIVEEIRREENSSFPEMNQPEPIEENLLPLSRTVLKKKAHLGIALDGDGDRLGIVDENGKYINSLQVFSLLSHYLINNQNQKSGIACTITMSSMIEKMGIEYNIPIFRTPVGFKHVGPTMIKQSCFIGGEESGGYAFKNHIPERDGILSGLIFLESLISSKQTVSKLISELNNKFGSHIYKRIDQIIASENQKDLRKKINSLSIKDIGGIPIVSIDRQDGVKLLLSDGSWIVFRMSGTEPLLRIYAESDTEDKLNLLLNESKKISMI